MATKMLVGNKNQRITKSYINSIEQAPASLKGSIRSVEDLISVLHECRQQRKLKEALYLHDYILQNNLQRYPAVGSSLVSTMVAYGSLEHAQQAFDSLGFHDNNSWNILISGYVKNGKAEHALRLYKESQKDLLVCPNGYAFAALLKACGELKDIIQGLEIHAEVARIGLLECDHFIGSTMVDMYAKCGWLMKARDVFDNLPFRNVVVWSSLITAYNENGQAEKALNCLGQMQQSSVLFDTVSFVCALKVCGSSGSVNKLHEIHAEIIIRGLETDLIVANTLLDVYAKCSLMEEAQAVFDMFPVKDMVMWTALITGHTENKSGKKALECFEAMQQQRVAPGVVTLSSCLKACESVRSVEKGQIIHAEITKKGFETELIVGSNLVNMYTKCFFLIEAQELFDKLPQRNVVIWTTLIAGYIEHGQGEQAIACFDKMQHEGISPNATTYVCVLKACASIIAIEKGQEIHSMINKENLLESDIFVGSALVDMYAKCGCLMEAQDTFDNLPFRNVVSWTSLIAGYAEHGPADEALSLFEGMQDEGISPSPPTFVSTLKACGTIEATSKGHEVHTDIACKGLEEELLVGNSLIDMYVKCGSLSEALAVFDRLPVHDVVSWTTVITGYAQRADIQNVFHMLDEMLTADVKPNVITFGGVLNACSHAGIVENGHMYLKSIGENHGCLPTIEHYACIIDLLGRAGHVDKAVTMIKKMPFHPDVVIWHSILGACRVWGEVELGRYAFEQAIGMDHKEPGPYICMSNIYAEAAMHEDMKKVEAMRVERQAWIKPGQSWWRDTNGILHSFPVEDHFTKTNHNHHGLLEECTHSEKMAIACALANTPEGTPIYVMKHPFICRDCHSAISAIVKIERRIIEVKDAKCVHVFGEKGCTCGMPE